MESVAISSATARSRISSAAAPSRIADRFDPAALGVWGLVGAIVLYLAIDGGGYDLVVRSQVGVIVWWIVLVSVAFGLLPVARLTRTGWAALALFGGFVAWTALASTWSLSSERSLQELSRVACYLGVLVLGITIHRDRERAIRTTVNALATAIVLVAALALASRLRPDLFPAAQQTASFLPGVEQRLGWPLNYWNALAALVGFGLPLLLVIATSARTLAAQAAAAAGVPLLALCGYLTFSRGGALAAAVALIVFLILAPERIPKLSTALLVAGGSAVLIAGAAHRSAIEGGLTNAVARHEGGALLVSVILVCAGVAVAQLALGLAARHGTSPRWLVVPRRRAGRLLAAAIVICIAGALLGGAPTLASHAWRDFKGPNPAALSQNSIARFGIASSNGRYDLWKAAVSSSSGHLLGGSGPGTFQLLWLPRAPYFSYVQNAHSLYLETLAEVGIVGLGLLVAFFLLVIGAALRCVLRARQDTRTAAAGAAAALLAFSVSAASDWVWQVPALPVAFLLLAAAVVAPGCVRRHPGGGEPASAPSRWGVRLAAGGCRAGAVMLAVACLLVIAVPLAITTAERRSQTAVSSGDPALALAAARAATRLEPGAASAQIQLALVLELRDDVQGALAAARSATIDEPSNWSAWLVRSRLEAEAGRPAASLAAFRRARSLNPRSPVFST